MAFGNPKDRAEEEPGQTNPAAAAVQSIIARGMVLDGDCETEGTLRIDGHVKGSVRAGNLTIAAGGRVDGDVTGSGGSGSGRAVVIEGAVGGTVRAHRVEVGPDGSVGSGLTVHEAVVRGRVRGPIEGAHRLVLEETAVVEGNVTAERLGLQEGARVFGTIRIGTAPGAEG